MKNPLILEACFKNYINNLSKWLPEGIIEVNLDLLYQLDLLHYHSGHFNSSMTRYFHVIESEEKLTLANEEFIVWIVPDKIDFTPVTYTLIALIKSNHIQLELCFKTTGIYNHSPLILKILEKFLMDIEITEALLNRLVQSNHTL